MNFVSLSREKKSEFHLVVYKNADFVRVKTNGEFYLSGTGKCAFRQLRVEKKGTFRQSDTEKSKLFIDRIPKDCKFR